MRVCSTPATAIFEVSELVTYSSWSFGIVSLISILISCFKCSQLVSLTLVTFDWLKANLLYCWAKTLFCFWYHWHLRHFDEHYWAFQAFCGTISGFLLNSIGHFRLYSKTEQLEQLMGEEVTDINEILAVINNIQVQSNMSRENLISILWRKVLLSNHGLLRPVKHY